MRKSTLKNVAYMIEKFFESASLINHLLIPYCPTTSILGLYNPTVPKMKLYRPTRPKIEQVPIQVIEQVLNKF